MADRGDGGVGVGRGVVHICIDGAGVGAIDLVEEDAVDGDVGAGVLGPGGVAADVGRHGAVGAIRIICVDVAERLDVFIAVEFGDGSDVILVGVKCRAGTAAGVYDYLPLHIGIRGDGGGAVAPAGGGGAGVDVEGEEDEEGGCGENEDEEWKEEKEGFHVHDGFGAGILRGGWDFRGC